MMTFPSREMMAKSRLIGMRSIQRQLYSTNTLVNPFSHRSFASSSSASKQFVVCKLPSSSRILFRHPYHRRVGVIPHSARCTSSIVFDHLSSALIGPNVKLNHPFSYQESNEGRILACSPTKHVSSEDHANWLRRFLRYIRRCLAAFWDVTLITWRSAQVVVILSPLSILTPSAVLVAQFVDSSNDQHNNPVAEVAWWYTIRALTTLGPVFVKMAQWVATRKDIFPPHVCDRLSTLHDHGCPHKWKFTEQTLKDSFGADYAERGLEVHEMIGCGSAAQVYRGSLTIRGDDDDDTAGRSVTKKVAIKVLHPQLNQLLERDLHLLEAAAQLMHSLPIESIRLVNLPRVAENFGYILRRQSDLTIEGDNLKRFRANFKHYDDHNDNNSTSAVWFPRPMDGWVTSNVLVEELVHDGTPISAFLRDSSKEGLQIRKELASPLLRAFLKMIFLDNFVHADIHPGNVLVRTTVVPQPRPWYSFLTRADDDDSKNDANTKTTVKRTIVFIDAGIATSLSPEDQKNLRDLFKAVLLNDGATAGRLMVERAKYERCSQMEGGVDAFANGVGEIVSEFHDRRKQGLTLGAVRIGSLLSRVLDLCRVYGVEIDPSMASIVISTLVLEGLGRSLEPSLNLIDFAIPFVLGRGKV